MQAERTRSASLCGVLLRRAAVLNVLCSASPCAGVHVHARALCQAMTCCVLPPALLAALLQQQLDAEVSQRCPATR
jgi:hypothetical protein